MVELDSAPAAAAYAAKARTERPRGRRRRVPRPDRRGRAAAAQRRAGAAPGRHPRPVLFGTHALYSGVAVTTDAVPAGRAGRPARGQGDPPLTPEARRRPRPSTTWPASARRRSGRPRENIGAGVRIGVIDTGIDYTHADFGGAGTAQAYTDAKADDDGPVGVSGPGQGRRAARTSPATPTTRRPGRATRRRCRTTTRWTATATAATSPGTAAGLGVDHDGNTFTGPYDTTTPGRHVPDPARRRAGRDDRAAQGVRLQHQRHDRPGRPRRWTGRPTPTATATRRTTSTSSTCHWARTSPRRRTRTRSRPTNAADLGIVVVAAAGNDGDVYDAGGSPGNAPSAISVAAADASGVIAIFSSRGVRGAGNLKPDITAPGKSRSPRWRSAPATSASARTARRWPRRTSPAPRRWSGRRYPDLAGRLGQGRAPGHRRGRGQGRRRNGVTRAGPADAGRVRAWSRPTQAVSTSVLAYSASEPGRGLAVVRPGRR